MTDKSTPKRTIERKKREAEALKANIRKRKEQVARVAEGKKSSTACGRGKGPMSDSEMG